LASPSIKRVLDEWRLGVVSDEISQDFEKACKVISELGAQWVEVRNLWNKNITDLSDEELRSARRIAERYGLRISNLDSFAFKCYLGDERAFKEHLRILRRVIEMSKALDIGFTRIFTFWWQGSFERVGGEVAEKLSQALDIASAEGVKLAVENEYSCTVGTGREARELLDRLRSRWLAVLWDPGNAFFAREDPYPTGFKAVEGLIAHVHLKDAAVEGGRFVWKPIGKGFIDYRGMLREMRGGSYILSLETHYRAPSGDLVESTRESFSGLVKLLEEVSE